MMTRILTLNKWNPERDFILRAAEIINSGGLVAFPTETVYGLGGDALNPESVKKIYSAKGRPSDNPLILHVSNINQAESLVYMNDSARKLAEIFWPAPLTLVLPAKNIIPSITRGGLNTAAVRMPDNNIALALIEASKTPIAAPSANLSGRPSPTDSESVYADMNNRIDLILDGGRTGVGLESTVIDITNPEKILLLRPGGLSRELIESELNTTLGVPDSNSAKRSPGTRYRHYAPSLPVKILRDESDLDLLDKNIKFAGYMGIHDIKNTNFSAKIIFDSPENFAHGLFAGFRELESQKISCIIVEWPQDNSGINEALRDRIKRAAGE